MVMRETVRRNRVWDGLGLSTRITRGTARRDHAFPHPSTPPSVVVTARSVDYAAAQAKAAKGVAVLTQPDQRWARCDIKTVGLLPNALAKQAAREAGAEEAWLIDDLGFITEGASTNAWIVDADGALRTRDTNANILRGITRKTLIDLAGEAGIEVSLRPFTVDEVKAAFKSARSTPSLDSSHAPVTSIDGHAIGDGRPGPVGMRLRRAVYVQNARATARWGRSPVCGASRKARQQSNASCRRAFGFQKERKRKSAMPTTAEEAEHCRTPSWEFGSQVEGPALPSSSSTASKLQGVVSWFDNFMRAASPRRPVAAGLQARHLDHRAASAGSALPGRARSGQRLTARSIDHRPPVETALVLHPVRSSSHGSASSRTRRASRLAPHAEAVGLAQALDLESPGRALHSAARSSPATLFGIGARSRRLANASAPPT